MTTFRYKTLEFILRLTGAGKSIEKGLAKGNVPSEKIPGSLRKRWETTEFEGRDVFTCRPEGEDTGRVYVHQHGGGYVIGLIALHFSMFTKLADMSGVTIVLPDYPLPPDMNSTEIIGWATRQYESIVAERGGRGVSLGGDSAGGNLALAISQMTKVTSPLLLLSPWVDVDPADMPDDIPNAEILLQPKPLKAAGRRYATPREPNDPLISPLFADPETLPEVMIFAGEKDLLFRQISNFAARMKSADKLVKLATYGEFGHYWMFYPTPDRESTLVELAAILPTGRPRDPRVIVKG